MKAEWFGPRKGIFIMALRWHVGLPGPFSVGGRVFKRSKVIDGLSTASNNDEWVMNLAGAVQVVIMATLTIALMPFIFVGAVIYYGVKAYRKAATDRKYRAIAKAPKPAKIIDIKMIQAEATKADRQRAKAQRADALQQRRWAVQWQQYNAERVCNVQMAQRNA